MPYYKCAIKVPDLDKLEGRFDSIEVKHQAFHMTENFNVKHNNSFGFVHEMEYNWMTLGIATKQGTLDEQTVIKFLKKLGCKHSSISIRETTVKEFAEMAHESNSKGYINSDELFQGIGIRIEKLYKKQYYDMATMDSKSGLRFEEHILKDIAKRPHPLRQAKSLLCDETLVPEIKRIYAEKSCDITNGHPVQYIIEADCADTHITVANILLSSLNANNRLDSKRNLRVKFCDEELKEGYYNDLCHSITGGAIVVSHVRDDNVVMNEICDALTKYNHEILHIFCLPKNSNSIRKQLLANADGVCFVTITEETVSDSVALYHLTSLAKKAKYKTDSDLYKHIEEGKSYNAKDLRNIFNNWRGTHLKNNVYKQYDAIQLDYLQPKLTKVSAYSKLSEMVGLNEAKKVINSTLDFFKAEKIFRKNGLSHDRPSMHMVFTGNPGTAKTSVARLFASIMKENNYLANSNFYEVGRAELIGKYTGHTAPKVKNAFRKARGGVLLIDEAYSLVDSRVGSFSDEAINTIVQEMENVRDDTVVIFTGYPDKMEEFLNKNPGLRSRIKFHVPFDDYTVDELFEIMELIAKNNDTILSNEVRDKLMPILRTAKEQIDFGNGRFVRNLFENAKMNQVSRLVKMDETKLRKADLTTLLAEDFVLPENMKRAKERIGFV